MKKTYNTPFMQIMKIETAGMLAVSGEVGGSATEPGHAPELMDEGFEPW